MRKRKLRRCNKTGLVIIETELQAKLVLAKRRWADKGETGYFSCGKHFHFTTRLRPLEESNG